jgi:hypothetical protein
MRGRGQGSCEDDHLTKMIIRHVTPSGRFSSGSSEDDHQMRRSAPIDGHLTIDGHQVCDTLWAFFPWFYA